MSGGTTDGATGSGLESPIPLGPLVIAGLILAALVAIGDPARPRGAAAQEAPIRARAARPLILAAYDVFADRAAELGWPRGAGETPEEYRGRLRAVEGLGTEDQERLRG